MRVRILISAALGFLAASLSLSQQARAQLGLPSRPSSTDSAATSVSSASPRAALQSFLRLAEANDWVGAAEYLSVSTAERDRASQLARRLKTILDQRLAIDVRTVSGAVSGDTTDGDMGGDRIGVITSVNGREDPVRMVRLSAPASGGPVRWVFSQATVGFIDSWFENLGAPWLRERLPRTLMREGPFNVYYWQWIGLGLAIPVVLLLAWGLGALLRNLLGRIARHTVTEWDDLLLEHLRGPFRLWAASLAIGPLLSLLDLNTRVAGFFTSLTRGLVLISIFWGLLRIIRLAQDRVANAAWATGQGTQARTLVPLLGNFLRVTLAIIALLVALAQFGYPVGTLLAGLGIGGIAVALAAQKTVEHLFGSVSLAADNAFRVGDWVRAGASEGAVERIGLRSTSIRTVDRTVVRIPNGRLADERIETFGERDRILLRTDIDLTYGTTPEQLERIRDALEAALRAHPLIFTDVVRVNVVAFTDSAIRVNVVAWFLTTDYQEFLHIRHAMLITFMRIIADNGSSFAFPSRTIYHVQQDGTTPVPVIGASAPAADV
ncbi:mechanosensitive ion channel family protein [Gemmatimonas groenlandica]|uniref:Mechanosensitive ion channel family protein n=1 Tax=Gemmatimonas groenlandica TaxID=2732249 RepID=A0A6M4IMC2_9BACT|nr:mechanosensitive ion channel family protein [Gemmatimonas groenlandica]QJR34566.1 mechanosensitive ion channel family protein [Gemmatimonas groenlandica]